MRKLKVFPFVFAVALTVGLAGCGSEGPPHYNGVTEDGEIIFNTENSIDPMNYTLYVNKKINVVLNVLEMHMANGVNVSRGSYPVQDEIDNVTESLDQVEEAIILVEGTNPPNEYEDERENVLRRMANAQNTLEAYKDALENNKISEITDYVDLMSGDFAALKASFNNPAE